MAERDRFELELAAALRAYAGDAPTQVHPTELARQFAAAYPHGRTTIAPWRLCAIPRPAWVLLLLAALLAAMVGGTLLVGSQLQRKLPAVVPPVGQLFACPPGSTPDKPGPVDQARPPLSGAIAFDRRAGQLVLVGRTVPDEGRGVETWTFDVCTNTWTRMHPNREPPDFEWARLVNDVDSDATILVSYGPGNVWAYDLQANTWTEKRGAPPGAWLSAYDPVSGLVMASGNADTTELWNYDVETDMWTPIHQTNGPSYAGFAYDASVDRMVAYTGVSGGHETWLFDIRTGTWSRSGAVTPHVLDWLTLPGPVYDEAAKRTVVGGNVRLAAYDATADLWETVEFPGPDPWHGVYFVYDPVNERLVVTSAGVVAYDLGTHEWTVLLEPSEVGPIPGSGQPAP